MSNWWLSKWKLKLDTDFHIHDIQSSRSIPILKILEMGLKLYFPISFHLAMLLLCVNFDEWMQLIMKDKSFPKSKPVSECSGHSQLF